MLTGSRDPSLGLVGATVEAGVLHDEGLKDTGESASSAPTCAVELEGMVARSDDALTRRANQNRSVAGALFGVATALVVSVPMAITGVVVERHPPRHGHGGAFTGLLVGLSSRKYDPAAAARPGTNQPYASLPVGVTKRRLSDDFSRRDKAIIFLGCMGWSVFIIVAGLVLQAKQLSYPGLAAWLIPLEGTALWFWVTRDRDG
jgi:hypothetical protein